MPADKPARMAPQALTHLLRDKIVSGYYPIGQQLVEDRLAKEYGVSRIPVREALRTLNAEGFIEVRPYRGAFVATLTAQAAADLLEIRGALEPIAARRAARNRSDEQVGQMGEILELGAEAAARGDLQVLPDLNTQFHNVIWTAACNAELLTILNQIRNKIAWVYSVKLRDRAIASWSEHTLILEAIGDRDDETAQIMMTAHIRAAESVYRLRRGKAPQPVVPDAGADEHDDA